MKNLIIISLILMVISSCNQPITRDDKVANIDSKYSCKEKVELKQDSLPKYIPQYYDSTNHDFPDYKITAYAEELGEVLVVFNKRTNSTYKIDDIDIYPYYLVTLIDSFLVLDSGSSATRGLHIYNLNSKAIVFNAVYHGNLEIENKKVYFNSEVKITDPKKRPICSTSKKNYYNGYCEEQIFDLIDLQLIKTEKYKCAYFE